MYAKNTWEKYANCVKDVMEYNEGYKDYISKNKTERACVKDSIRLAGPSIMLQFCSVESSAVFR